MKINLLKFFQLIIFFLLFISFTSANFDLLVRISGTWTKLKEFQWLVRVNANERFQCFIYKQDSEIKYEGKFLHEFKNKDMLFNFKINENKEKIQKCNWNFECILIKHLFIHQLVEHLKYQLNETILPSVQVRSSSVTGGNQRLPQNHPRPIIKTISGSDYLKQVQERHPSNLGKREILHYFN
uniref:Uncharacterized protein n=1 Tax=Meloidogyne hapla TaxID=6305 RepID=A0A1I8BFN1_MELHA